MTERNIHIRRTTVTLGKMCQRTEFNEVLLCCREALVYKVSSPEVIKHVCLVETERKVNYIKITLIFDHIVQLYCTNIIECCKNES